MGIIWYGWVVEWEKIGLLGKGRMYALLLLNLQAETHIPSLEKYFVQGLQEKLGELKEWMLVTALGPTADRM